MRRSLTSSRRPANEWRAPAMSVAVVDDGRITWARGFGRRRRRERGRSASRHGVPHRLDLEAHLRDRDPAARGEGAALARRSGDEARADLSRPGTRDHAPAPADAYLGNPPLQGRRDESQGALRLRRGGSRDLQGRPAFVHARHEVFVLQLRLQPPRGGGRERIRSHLRGLPEGERLGPGGDDGDEARAPGGDRSRTAPASTCGEAGGSRTLLSPI